MHLPRLFKGKGPLLAYLEVLAKSGHEKQVAEVVRAVRRVAATDDGAILFRLIEEATLLAPELEASSRALRQAHAQRFIAQDLQRIASDESDRLLGQGNAGSAPRGHPGR